MSDRCTSFSYIGPSKWPPDFASTHYHHGVASKPEGTKFRFLGSSVKSFVPRASRRAPEPASRCAEVSFSDTLCSPRVSCSLFDRFPARLNTLSTNTCMGGQISTDRAIGHGGLHSAVLTTVILSLSSNEQGDIRRITAISIHRCVHLLSRPPRRIFVLLHPSVRPRNPDQHR